MKRDMDLARLILFEVEKQPYEGDWVDINIEGYLPEEISYHTMLLSQAGFIEADKIEGFQSMPDWKAKTLTWQGHEFLEASKDEGRWNKAKTIVKEKSGSLSFEVLKTVLIELAKITVLSGLKGA